MRIVVIAIVVAIFSTLAFIAPLIGSKIAPGGKGISPWKVTVNQDGSTVALGVTLGKSTLGALMEQIGKRPDINLFTRAAGTISVEADFGNVNFDTVNGLMVVILDPKAQWVKPKIAEKDRPATAKIVIYSKFSASEPDLGVLDTKIVGISFVPKSWIDEPLLLLKFGKPDKVITAGKDLTQWRYPDIGVVATISLRGKDLLQYIRPSEVATLPPPRPQ